MSPATTMLLIVAALTLTALATWALCILADDPPAHCTGCTCGLPGSHVRLRPPAGAAAPYDYEHDTA
jgi:hypothetical protein